MPAQPYITGPADVFVGLTPTGSAPVSGGGSVVSLPCQFLGNAEQSPDISIRPEFEDLHVTISGTRIPLDRSFQGESAVVSVAMPRYDEAVYAAIADRVRCGLPRGSYPATALGTLMIFEAAATQLWIRFRYGHGNTAKGAMTAGGMPAGYHFFGAILQGPDELKQLNTKNRLTVLTWQCLPVLVGANWKCYDHDMSAVGAVS
jgi:hypothetical protein